MIKKLNRVGKQDIDIVGSKAANLGELYKKGFNVPDGFVVTTRAYNDFLEDNNLNDKITAELQEWVVEDIEGLEKISENIRCMFESASLNKELNKQINRLFTQLTAEHFAVRSSAVNEDLPGASFAGQLDTFLNVPKNQVSSRVKSVFSSLFNSRAIYYRQMKQFTHEAGTAVIIQEMIPAEFAGVLFTIDPIKRKNILLEIAPGLGDKVVSGTVSPNNYFVNRDSFEIEESEEANMGTFAEETVKKIARIGMEIEKHFAQPQDVEFAVVNDEIFILQARPITIFQVKKDKQVGR